jgi:hypothetical protein
MSKHKNFPLPFIALLIKWSGLAVTDGRNKIGGTVFGTGKGGAFARNKVTPINRRSAKQSLVRSIFAAFSQQFRTLTAAQIAAWNTLAGEVTYHNIFGDAKTLSGKALFIRINANLTLASQATVTNAPAIVPAATCLGTDPNASVAGTNMYVNAIFPGLSSVVPAGSTMLVSATKSLSKGVSSVGKSQYRDIANIPAAGDTTTANMWADYVAKFGAPAVGANVWLQVRMVNNTTGFSGTPISGQVVVGA